MRIFLGVLLFISLVLGTSLFAEEVVSDEKAPAKPEMIDTKQMVDMMIAARKAEKNKDFEGAERLLNELSAYTPDSPLVRERLNRVRAALGKAPLPDLKTEKSEISTDPPPTSQKSSVAVDTDNLSQMEAEPNIEVDPLGSPALILENNDSVPERDSTFPSILDEDEEKSPPVSQKGSGAKDDLSTYVNDEQEREKPSKKEHFEDLKEMVYISQDTSSVQSISREEAQKPFSEHKESHLDGSWKASAAFKSDKFNDLFDDLRNNVISLENSHDSLKMDVAFLEGENKKLREELKEKISRVEDLVLQLSVKGEEIDELKASNLGLGNDLEKEFEKNDYLKKRISLVLKDKDKLQRKLSVVLADSRIYDNMTSSVQRLAAFQEEIHSLKNVPSETLDRMIESDFLWQSYLTLVDEDRNADEVEEALFKAANLGSDEAMMEIVRLRENGKILAYNTRPIFDWILLAAKHGNTKAMEKLGDLFAEGDFYVSQNPVEAFAWYEVASFRDNMNVVPKLRTLESELIRSGKKNLLTDGRILASEILSHIQ